MEAKSHNSFINEREFDLIVLGASGFTGQFVVEEVTRSSINDPIKWAVSGRNVMKLYEVLANISKETGIDIKHIPIIEADINNEETLKAMAARTVIVLNCVGPYYLYGEQMVKVCIETGTHHLDVSMESQYLEGMQLKYHTLAKEKGIFIIGSCAFGSIPSDLGIRFLKKNFKGKLNSVEVYNYINFGPQRYRANYGTMLSGMYMFLEYKYMKSIRNRINTEIYEKRVPIYEFKLKKKIFPFKNKFGWCVPFPWVDIPVINRSEQYRYEHNNEMPTQIGFYHAFSDFLTLMLILFISSVILSLSYFKCGRSLLMSYPKLFTFGIFSKEGPTRQQIRDTSFVTTIVGKGWVENLSKPSDRYKYKPNMTVVAQVKGPDPGYVTTSICLVQSAITLLRESDKMPKDGGVLTPGAAFADTGIYDRLRDREILIEMI